MYVPLSHWQCKYFTLAVLPELISRLRHLSVCKYYVSACVHACVHVCVCTCYSADALLNSCKPWLVCDCHSALLSPGFTPMVKLLSERLIVQKKKEEWCTSLLFANKTEKDILWKEQLEQLEHTLPRCKLMCMLITCTCFVVYAYIHV